jgi:hypothetical protein
MSTDGQLCFGVPFEVEDQEFPWDLKPWHGDIEDWWSDINGFQKDRFNPFDEDGNYKVGVEEGDPRIATHFLQKRAFFEAHPLPVEEVMHCHSEYPMTILAVPGTRKTANRGDVIRIHPSDLEDEVGEFQKSEAVMQFVNKYGLKEDAGELGWYLTSYWG